MAIALQQALSPTRSVYGGRYGPEPGGSRRLPSRQAPAHTRKQTNKQTDKASLSNHNKQAHKHTIETFNQHVLTLAMEKSKGGLAFALQHKAVKAPMTKNIRPLKDDDKDHEAVVATLKRERSLSDFVTDGTHYILTTDSDSQALTNTRDMFKVKCEIWIAASMKSTRS